MIQNQTIEQTQEVSQAVETEKENQGGEVKEVSLGKFKDVNALLSAYNSLQSEFTKRCQRVKELESVLAVDKEKTPTSKGEEQVDSKEESKGITEEDKQNILKDYLKGLLQFHLEYSRSSL